MGRIPAMGKLIFWTEEHPPTITRERKETKRKLPPGFKSLTSTCVRKWTTQQKLHKEAEIGSVQWQFWATPGSTCHDPNWKKATVTWWTDNIQASASASQPLYLNCLCFRVIFLSCHNLLHQLNIPYTAKPTTAQVSVARQTVNKQLQKNPQYIFH